MASQMASATGGSPKDGSVKQPRPKSIQSYACACLAPTGAHVLELLLCTQGGNADGELMLGIGIIENEAADDQVNQGEK